MKILLLQEGRRMLQVLLAETDDGTTVSVNTGKSN